MNSGSFDNLKVSPRCGCRAKARQMRFTVLRLSPEAAASDRVDQWRVASWGVDSRVMVNTLSTSASLTRRGACQARRLVQQSVQPPLHKTLPPLTHRLASHLKYSGHLGVGVSSRTQ